MKALTVIFGTGVVGIAVCLVMTIYTGVKEHQERNAPVTHAIPVPAMSP